MAWTDSSRTSLIDQVKLRPVLWDRTVQGDPNSRLMRHEAIREIVEILNTAYYPHISKHPYTADEVRSQWKNLKDTYKRKQRWLSEGKYSRDPAEEPTWKFFRQLRFLEKGDEGPLREDGTSSNDAPELTVKYEPHNSSFEERNTENSMDILLKATEQHAQNSMLENKTNIIPTMLRPQPTVQREEAVPVKRPRETPLPTVSSPPLLTINSAQDDFAHFGQYVAVILRKMAGEGNRLEALKLQKKISDLIFESQFDMCQEK